MSTAYASPVRCTSNISGGGGMAMSWVGLAAASWSAAEPRLKAEFDVAHAQDTLDGALAQLAGQREDIHGHGPKLLVQCCHPIKFAGLIGCRFLGSPAVDLLGVDVHEHQLLNVDLVDAINGGVIQDMRARLCFGQRLDVLARVVQGAVSARRRESGGNFRQPQRADIDARTLFKAEMKELERREAENQKPKTRKHEKTEFGTGEWLPRRLRRRKGSACGPLRALAPPSPPRLPDEVFKKKASSGG